MRDVKIGFALCGSFCTFSKVIPQIEKLKELGADITPIMSPAAASFDTRFGKAKDFADAIEKICNKSIIKDIVSAEPIGPQSLLDILVISPCTGNTISKLSAGITDNCVTMAAKSTLRNSKPVVIAVSTNDGLSNSAKNIGILLNAKGYYFVPFSQDDPEKKAASLVAHFELIPDTVSSALNNIQIQPILMQNND